MLVLKGCPHCHGDLVFERDSQAAYLACIQCGHTLSCVEERSLGVRSVRRGLVHIIRYTTRETAARRAPAVVS